MERKGSATSRASQKKRKRRHQEILDAWNKLRSQAARDTSSFFSDVDLKTLASVALVSVLAVVAVAMLMACLFSGECERPHLLHQLSGHLGRLQGLQAAPTCLFGPYKSCELPKSGGDWGEWSKCNAKCGNGNRTRIRTDHSVAEAVVVQIASCSAPKICASSKVFAWAHWLPWQQCTKTCGPTGLQDRSRKCQAEKESEVVHPSNCPGMSGERRQCNNDVQCPMRFMWGWWTQWSSCTKTCDDMVQGIHVRSRLCVSDTSVVGNPRSCKGHSTETRRCNNIRKCPDFDDWE